MVRRKIRRDPETHPLTWRMREDRHPVWIEEYVSRGGYDTIPRVLRDLDRYELVSMVADSGLRGRGGAGFPTGRKWKLICEADNRQDRYLICNADEMEPGTYKDKLLMERLPHLLVEGMILSAYALGVKRGYVFLRGEYVEAEKNLRRAISEATERMLIGERILRSDFSFEIVVHVGAGRYICGEETALMNSLEGRRAVPRLKPPFPSTGGLWGKPTCINNVETLCNVPIILENGAMWYRNLSSGKSRSAGTKLMGISGRVNRPGIWELPFGTTAREILEDHAGGMCAGSELKAWQPGGISTDFLTADHLDTPMDFESLEEVGSRLGTAAIVIVDDSINMPRLVCNIEKFFARESCGWCTPCREGLSWVSKILLSLSSGDGCEGDVELLEELCAGIGVGGGTFCALAPGAIAPLRSAIRHFRHEFEFGAEDSPSLTRKS